MSRHQVHVATSIPYRPGRDVSSMSRPPGDYPMSRHPTLLPMSRHQSMSRRQLQLSPISATSRSYVATSLAATHVATSNDVATSIVHPETYCHLARSRHHFLVATSRSTRPGRDLITMSRPQEVLTHNEFFFSATLLKH